MPLSPSSRLTVLGHDMSDVVVFAVVAEVGKLVFKICTVCTSVQIRTTGTGDAVGLLVSKGEEDL